MDVAGAGIIKQVRAKAEMSGDPGVYTLAMIPPPAKPTPVGAPGLPYHLKAALKPACAPGTPTDNPPTDNQGRLRQARPRRPPGQATGLGQPGPGVVGQLSSPLPVID